MGVTTALNILGGAGTVCAAFLTEQFESMLPLLQYQWLYQTLMIVTLLIGGVGIWTTLGLVRGGPKAYSTTLIVLGAGTVAGAVHVFASLMLRGKTVPANMKLYANLLTLLVFLIFRLPGIRERVDFSEPVNQITQTTSSGLAALISGIVIITTPIWVASSHTYEGIAWVDVLRAPLYISGGGSIILGVLLLIRLLRISNYNLQKGISLR
jgi:hypothetical protein